MQLPAIPEHALAVLVFGPGTGELIVVHAPGGHWMLVDGCRRQQGRWYGQRVLDHYAATSALVLTHPHRDHAGGVADLIDEHCHDEQDDWPLLGLLPPPEPHEPSTIDADAAQKRGLAEDAVAAIQDRWERRPRCRWELGVGAHRSFGAATFEVVAPLPRPDDTFGRDPNERSSVLRIVWDELCVVLSGDLAPKSAWTRAIAHTDDLPRHHAWKVPHHGSVEALHATMLTSSPTAPRVLTPFASANVPSFEANGGVAQLLEAVAEVWLTSLPRAHGQQSATPEIVRLDELMPDGRHIAFDSPTSGFPDTFVAFVWDSPSDPPAIHPGPGSVKVVR
ncbi:MAG: hypothetical protein MUE69_11855 [Myxococcota bacterium]|nr:hypothetical protein [Myxococcota bacterium]